MKATHLTLAVNNDPEEPILKVNPTEPNDVNWLGALPEHTVFLCQEKQKQGFMLSCLEVLSQWPHATHLAQQMGDMMPTSDFWVVTEKFSQIHRCVEILHEPNNQEVPNDPSNPGDSA